MPTQLQLEGADLEALLAQVRSEHGAAARIVSAEKVRTGGVGGFFAKQHFEITVEVGDLDGGAPVGAARAAAGPAASLLDLADAVSDSERSAASVSTESTGFAAVLARLGATAGATEPVDAPLRATPTTVPAQRRSPEVLPAPAPRPGPPVRRAATSRRPAPARSRRRPTPAVAAPLPVAQARPGVLTVAAPGAAALVPRAGAVAVRTRRAVAATPGRAAAGPSSRRATVATPTPSTPAGALDATSAVRAQLARLGLPEDLHPACGQERLYPALLASLRRLPKPPRAAKRAGAVLAVVGPLPQALEVGRQIARELGLPTRSSVVVATSGRTLVDLDPAHVLRDPAEAGDRVVSWRRRKTCTVVVVDAPMTAAGALQARAYLHALQPQAVHGVVEATRKAHDVGTWARAVGRVDALALTAVEETVDPASVLQLGIPVGRLGSARATPAAWASLLAGRVAA